MAVLARSFANSLVILAVSFKSLASAFFTWGTLKRLAEFSVLSHLKEPDNSRIFSKMRIYDCETLKDIDHKAKAMQEYKDAAGVDEGMNLVRGGAVRQLVGLIIRRS